jgi:hypothetical protein
MRRIAKVLAICALFAVVFGAIVYVGFDIAGRAGQSVKAVLVIEARESEAALTGHLLRPVTETDYRRTSTSIRALIEPTVRVIMGTTDDLKPGAIAQFDGVADGQGAIRVRRIVILSAYIHVVGG